MSEVEKLQNLVEDMYWEYDRMSSSGQQTLDKIANILGLPTENEVTKMAETVKNG
tara:strand:+ start:33 stop:197 length:165 start_codon:yes stop_codon:yes gene_type:complete